MPAVCVSMTCRLRAAERVCYPTYTGGEAAGACWLVHRSCAFTFDLVGRTAQCAVDMHTDGRGSDTHSKGRDGDTHMDHRRPELRRRVSPAARDLRPPSLTWMGRRDSCRQPFAAFRRRFPPLSGRHSGHDHGSGEASRSPWCGITLHPRMHPQVSLHVTPVHALSPRTAVTLRFWAQASSDTAGQEMLTWKYPQKSDPLSAATSSPCCVLQSSLVSFVSHDRY